MSKFDQVVKVRRSLNAGLLSVQFFPSRRDEGLEVIGLKSPKDILQPFASVNAGGLAAGNQRVDYGSALHGCVVPAEEIVLASQSNGSYDIFGAIVIDLIPCIVDIS